MALFQASIPEKSVSDNKLGNTAEPFCSPQKSFFLFFIEQSLFGEKYLFITARSIFDRGSGFDEDTRYPIT